MSHCCSNKKNSHTVRHYGTFVEIQRRMKRAFFELRKLHVFAQKKFIISHQFVAMRVVAYKQQKTIMLAIITFAEWLLQFRMCRKCCVHRHVHRMNKLMGILNTHNLIFTMPETREQLYNLKL